VNHFDTALKHRPAFRRHTAWAGALALLLALLFILPSLAAPAQPSAQQYVYVPLVMKGGTSPNPPPPPPPAQGGVFTTRDTQTTGAGAAVDAQGGMHFAYIAYTPLEQNPRAYYAYCPGIPASACADPASWRIVTLSQRVDEVQIALSPAGQPRLLIRSIADDYSVRVYSYAACDSRCTEVSQWAMAEVATTSDVDATDWEISQRSFALDRLGRPRFVYYTGGLGDPRKGAFYAYCDADCTANSPEEPHWFETQISLSDDYSYEIIRYPALTFTQHNQPRVLAMVFANEGQQSGIFYYGCDQACGDASSWQRVYLIERGWGPLASWDLELDGSDRPRVAIYQEGLDGGGGDRLIYAWCDSKCLVEENWHGAEVGLPQHDGEDPDLELDQQGRPRIAYHAAEASGLGYLWCNAVCETNSAQWQQMIAEDNDILDQTFPLPVPIGCDQAAWSGGFRPALVLDAQGNPRIGTDAHRLMRCWYEDPNNPGHPYQRTETYWYTRFVFLPQR
jgi:hypothetical protein